MPIMTQPSNAGGSHRAGLGAACLRNVALLLSAMIAPRLAAQAASTKPLSVADAMATRTIAYFAPISLSPDGQWVAYTVTNPKKIRTHTDAAIQFLPTGTPIPSEGSELWITNTHTGESRDLTGPSGASWDGVWSPDGRQLAFYSDRGGRAQVWIWDRETGKSRRVSPLIAHPFFPFEAMQWTPDGRQLLVKLLPEGVPLETTPDTVARAASTAPNDSVVTVVVYSANTGKNDSSSAPAFVSQRITADLALMSVADGRVRRLVRRSPVMRAWISPTGRDIAFTISLRMVTTPEITNLYDVGVVDVATGRTRIVAKSVLHYWGPPVSWSPDGTRLAFTTKRHYFQLFDNPGRPLPAGDCFVVDLATDSVRNVSPGTHADLSSEFHPPVWDSAGTTLYTVGGDTLWRLDARRGGLTAVASIAGRKLIAVLSPTPEARPWLPEDGDHVLVRTLDATSLRAGVARIDLRTGADTLLFEDDEALPGEGRVTFGVDAAQKVLVYQRQDASHPQDLWVAGPDFSDRHRLTHINPQLDAYTFGRSQLVRWRSDDGDSLRGALLLPANYRPGTRYPLIVWVYGGEQWSMFANNFGVIPIDLDYMQLLATRGFAVLVPDAPQHIGTPMLDLAKTVLPGVNKVIDLGIADPERLGIMGQSYGCASTLMIIVQTTRFKAAVCASGTSSVISMAGLLGGEGSTWANIGQGKMGGTVWQHRERYIENSPYFYLDRVTTPVLIVQGTSDRASPPFQSDATFEALRQLGKRVVYLRYDGEGHGPMLYSAANRAHYLNRVVRWFDEYLSEKKVLAP